MPPPAILSSPFLTHSVLDTLLANNPSPSDRIQLLSAKVHLYSHSPLVTPVSHSYSSSSTRITSIPATGIGGSSAPLNSTADSNFERCASSRLEGKDQARIPEMRTRLALASAQMENIASSMTGAQQVEATLRIVLDWTKGVEKGILRRRRADGSGVSQKVEGPAGGQVGEGGGESEDERRNPSWVVEVMAIRMQALGTLIKVEEGMGRVSRVEALRKQLAEVGAMQGKG